MSISPSTMSKSKQNEYYEYHIEAVFNDIDFINTVEHLVVELDEEYGWRDLDFKEKGLILLTNPGINMKLDQIADDFYILSEDIMHYLLDMSERGYPTYRNKAFLQTDEKRKTMNLRLKADIKKDEFEALWKRVSLAQKSMDTKISTRKRPPENYQLVYAITKARMKGDTMPALYKAYKNGTLPGYNGSKSFDQTEFNHYYSKYAPFTSLS